MAKELARLVIEFEKETPFLQVLQSMIAMNYLSYEVNGIGLLIGDTKEFDKTNDVYREQSLTTMVPRLEVYIAIRDVAQRYSDGEVMIQDLENRYPHDAYGSELPRSATLHYIFNTYFRSQEGKDE